MNVVEIVLCVVYCRVLKFDYCLCVVDYFGR